MSNKITPVVLIILDGWGIAPPWGGNALYFAKTPCYDQLIKKFPYTTLQASGEAVGLPGHERGNSEAGHLNIGAGKIVHQDVNHISKLITEGTFFKNEVLLNAINHVKKYHSKLHLLGLLSDGGIHSHINHLFALLDLCVQQGVDRLFIHVFTDGRDTEPQGALSYILKLERKLKEIKIGQIASVSGRYYAMDRDKRWDRTEKAYLAIASALGPSESQAPSAISRAYQKGLTDEFITPTVIKNPKVEDNDAIIFFNVRGDRARQLTLAFTDPKFKEFKTTKYKNLFFVTFTWYGEYIPNTQFAFSPEEVKQPLAKVLSDNKLNQFHIAETEKYAHVTYFFNGGREEPFWGEDRKMIPSPKVATYNLKPEMSAKEVADEVYKAISFKKYDFIVVNFANPDMVGHTGDLKAAIKAAETVDQQLKKLIDKIIEDKIIAMITADHGNIEQMVNPKTGEIDTEHTSNPVPFILVTPDSKPYQLRSDGKLANVAPTILEFLQIEKPKEMTEGGLCLTFQNRSY
jgi:2,3-bisphosphoglycerate-independent phosphoglycerate mutase